MSRPDFIELPSIDLDAAKRFYSGVFGLALTDFGSHYACSMTGDVDIGLQADMAEASAAPLVVIAVEDLSACLEAVIASGGLITKPVFAFPGGRRFHFKDPNGNELAAWEKD